MSDIPPKDYIDSVAFPDSVVLRPIGRVCSPYRERFGTPRQASVVTDVHDDAKLATIELFPSEVPESALRDLATFDRVWVIAWLHLNKHWKPLIMPPRGPRVKRGVLATRAPHRPNQLGLSAVELVAVEGHTLHLRGIDLLDGTPVLDVKPYVPYADAFPDASAGWVDELGEAPSAPDRFRR